MLGARLTKQFIAVSLQVIVVQRDRSRTFAKAGNVALSRGEGLQQQRTNFSKTLVDSQALEQFHASTIGDVHLWPFRRVRTGLS